MPDSFRYNPNSEFVPHKQYKAEARTLNQFRLCSFCLSPYDKAKITEYRHRIYEYIYTRYKDVS